MLDSDQEPSYNLSKIFLLLPRILKLLEDMIDDSTLLDSGVAEPDGTYKHENCFLQSK